MIFLFLADHIGFLADAVSVPLIICKRVNRAVGWMTGILFISHIIMALVAK